MGKGDDIQERLIQFAARIIKVCMALSKKPFGKQISKQLMHSGLINAALAYFAVQAFEREHILTRWK